MQYPYLLSKDDLFDDDMEKAESEYDITKFQAWWKTLKDKPISTDLMKDIVARCGISQIVVVLVVVVVVVVAVVVVVIMQAVY